MITADRLLLLDTSVVLHLVRGNEVAKRMDAAYALRTRSDRPLISIVSLGEARSFALQLDWGDSKVDLLERLLRELTVVDHPQRHRSRPVRRRSTPSPSATGAA